MHHYLKISTVKTKCMVIYCGNALQYVSNHHHKHLRECTFPLRKKLKQIISFKQKKRTPSNSHWPDTSPEKIVAKLEQLKFKGLHKLAEDYARSDSFHLQVLLVSKFADFTSTR